MIYVNNIFGRKRKKKKLKNREVRKNN